MINKIWGGMIIAGVIFAAFNGRIEAVSNAFLNSARDSINILIKLAGPMVFWMGIMKVAQEGGIVKIMARCFRPLASFLFPEIPADHPALGAILMNFSANLFGLGNSATPLGIKAMEELEKLNNNSDRPSDAMCTFLVINTSGLTLIPGTILALRVGAGSLNPAEIMFTTIFATSCSTVVGIVSNKILLKFGNRFNV